MQDARINTGLPGHPKTKKLMRRLGPSGPWSLVCLFLWTAANRSNGDLSGMSDEDIELAADWNGDEGQLVQELASVGFLDGDSGAYVIHDWAEHNPWAAGAADRSEASKWAALCKRYGRDGAADRMPDYADRMRTASDSHATGTNPQCDPDAPLPSPLPSPSPKQEEPNGSLSAKTDVPNCPHDDIVSLYHEILPANPRIKVWDGDRAKLLRTRWREDSKRQSLDYWRRFFGYVGKSEFLTGRTSGREGRPFTPGLEWLVKSSNFAKIIEGRYHGDSAE